MESRLKQIKADPNFSYDLSSVERAKKDTMFKDIIVLTPDPHDPNIVHVFQKACYHVDIFISADMIKRHRMIKVTQNGDIEIYDGQRKVYESPNLYLFSENAINLYEQIKKQGFYHSFEENRFELYEVLKGSCILPFGILNTESSGLRYRQHCETLDFYYKSDVTGKMMMDGREQDVANAAYIVSINRAGEISYQLRFHTNYPDSYSWHLYRSVEEIHDPKVKEFHQQFIALLLSDSVKHTALGF